VRDLTHVHVNVSPTVERVLARRRAAEAEQVERRCDKPVDPSANVPQREGDA